MSGKSKNKATYSVQLAIVSIGNNCFTKLPRKQIVKDFLSTVATGSIIEHWSSKLVKKSIIEDFLPKLGTKCIIKDFPYQLVMQSSLKDCQTEPRPDPRALIFLGQVAEKSVDDPNNTLDLLTFVLQKLSSPSSKPQTTMVLLDNLIYVIGFSHCRYKVIKVRLKFAEAEKEWAYLGLTKEELLGKISYENILLPAIAKFHITASKTKRGTIRLEVCWRQNWRITIDSVHRSFPAKVSEHSVARFSRLGEKTTSSHVAKTIKDTINSRISHARHGVR